MRLTLENVANWAKAKGVRVQTGDRRQEYEVFAENNHGNISVCRTLKEAVDAVSEFAVTDTQ